MARTLPRDPGEALRQLRQDRGLTQMQLRDQSGLSQTVISQVEGGERRMTFKTARKIELALGLEPFLLVKLIEEAYGTGGYLATAA